MDNSQVLIEFRLKTPNTIIKIPADDNNTLNLSISENFIDGGKYFNFLDNASTNITMTNSSPNPHLQLKNVVKNPPIKVTANHTGDSSPYTQCKCSIFSSVGSCYY